MTAQVVLYPVPLCLKLQRPKEYLCRATKKPLSLRREARIASEPSTGEWTPR